MAAAAGRAACPHEILKRLYEMCNVRREAGGNLIEEMAALLDKRIAAARRELADARFNLGISSANGQGIPRDDAEAAWWFRLAAEQGDARAQYYLGFMCANGRGMPRNDGEAARWLQLFAAQDDHYARFLLDLLDSDTLHVPQDDVAAYMWASLAWAQGNEDARELRDRIAQRMNAGQIAAAQRAASEWLPTRR